MYKNHDRVTREFPGIETVYWGNRNEIGLRINHARAPEGPIQDPVHGHHQGVQHFVVLSGKLLIEVAGQELEITPDQALEIMPETLYRVLAAVDGPCEWMVICTVNTDTDRFEP